ncbi:hypothetical protein [Kribbella jiaozuonensis]|uniref:Uncharacterized protein n=1 Tax=Kribbella jiaozuonensis TaxID=2575441 RepID=A0A4U3M4D4_9ACTN|nr:hypothetical protein [Kribbella jiaozuonensis]TKK79160.1 hypothetical protein FDA38_12065 [Kribbella jiaozuonensis]TKK83230.1 hypothetical protein FDA38_11020 [Kribbella jiaozuonensis]
MTDAGSPGTEWVPRFGDPEVSRDRADLIRGLFELAGFVANYPELPLPQVNAVMIPGGSTDADGVWTVAAVAEALGVATGFGGDGAFVAQSRFGPVSVRCVARLAAPPGGDRREAVAGEGR